MENIDEISHLTAGRNSYLLASKSGQGLRGTCTQVLELRSLMADVLGGTTVENNIVAGRLGDKIL